MTTDSTARTRPALTGGLVAGVIGGIVGGVGFGLVMAGGSDLLLPMIGQLVNSSSDSAALGWVVHLAISIIAGGLFGAILTMLTRSGVLAAVLGPIYGLIWWALGGMMIMPAWLGMSEMIFDWNDHSRVSLWGHLAFGLILGLTYAVLAPRMAKRG